MPIEAREVLHTEPPSARARRARQAALIDDPRILGDMVMREPNTWTDEELRRLVGFIARKLGLCAP
jgi:hypothetical protein